MVALLYLIPLALLLGGLGLAAFVWSLRSGQYEDLEGAAHRVLLDEDEDAGITPQTFLGRLAGADIQPDASPASTPRGESVKMSART